MKMRNSIGRLLGILIMLLSLQVSAQTVTISADKDSKYVNTREKVDIKENVSYRVSTGLTDFKIESRGKIEVTDDDKDIKSISDDGYLEITKTVFGSKRAIIIESLGGGKIKKEYYEGRTKMDWEPNGRQWLGEILPEIVQTTTLGAEGRVNRFYKQGGVNGVLSEIGRIESDYVKAHYAKLLFAKNISDQEMPNAITRISESISSAYYLSNVLQNNIDKMLSTPASADAFFKGAQKISSDYYKSVVLKEALKKYAASPNQTKVILQTAATMSSDYYLSVVLTTLLEQRDIKEETLTELVSTSTKINSDYYRSQVLEKALDKQSLSKAALKNTVTALTDINSDYYKTQVFNSMVEKNDLDPEIQLQIVNALANSVNSDYYASATLNKMIEHQKLSEEAFNKLVVAASNINSDHYASVVLKEASQKELTKNELITLLNAATNINSDHYLTDVLLNVAAKVKASDSSVKDAYRQAAKNIGSDTYYGRAVKAID